ncbi:MAG: polysaccharide biosynthesis protein [uncultured bacterium]|nr:MAG: polysaccharide biosynthesis protein [uncultured bacterium]
MVKAILHDDYLTGIYNASLTVGRIPYYVFYALTIMLLPVVSKSTAQNDHAGANAVIKQSLRLMTILLIPSVILMAQFSQPIINIFYSLQYADAALPMAILAYGVGFLTIFYVMSFVLNGAGKTKIPMWISIFGFIVNAVLNYFLIKTNGLAGSAIATTITSFIIMLAILFFIQRDFGTLITPRSLLKMLTAGLVTYLVSNLLPTGNLIFLISCAFLFAFYLSILIILRELNASDWNYLVSIVSKKKKRKEIQEELSGNEPSA